MEFLGIGPLELLVIFVLVLIIFSPKDLAQAGRTMGRWLNRLNRSETWQSMRQVSTEVQNLPARLAREAQLEELKELQKGIQLEGGSPYADSSRIPPMPAAPAPAQGSSSPTSPQPEKTDPNPEAAPPSPPAVEASDTRAPSEPPAEVEPGTGRPVSGPPA
jgi:Sec-independent protein translocase protein TatA